jgi:hypothetical protein
MPVPRWFASSRNAAADNTHDQRRRIGSSYGRTRRLRFELVASGETRSGIARLERRNSLGDGRIATDQVRSAADRARRVEHSDEDSRDIVARDLPARQALT